MKLAARTYLLLLGGAFPAGNIMEACKAKWMVDRLDFKAFPFLANCGATCEGFRQGSKPQGLSMLSQISMFLHGVSCSGCAVCCGVAIACFA